MVLGRLKAQKSSLHLKKTMCRLLRVMCRLSIQFQDFSVFRNIHAAFNALTAYKFTHIGAADGGMIHGIHVYGDDFGFRHDLAGFNTSAVPIIMPSEMPEISA